MLACRRLPRSLFVTVTLAGFGALATSYALGVRLNISKSIPTGLYRQRPAAPEEIHQGVTVLACLPERVTDFGLARGYLPRGACPGGGMPVGKRILAVAGDTVVVTDLEIVVNHRAIPGTRPLRADTRHRPLPRLQPGLYVVRNGEAWLGSEAPTGFDSRYYGPVPTRGIYATIQRLSLW